MLLFLFEPLAGDFQTCGNSPKRCVQCAQELPTEPLPESPRLPRSHCLGVCQVLNNLIRNRSDILADHRSIDLHATEKMSRRIGVFQSWPPSLDDFDNFPPPVDASGFADPGTCNCGFGRSASSWKSATELLTRSPTASGPNAST